MIQNFKCNNCGSKLKKINGNQWKCEYCDSIFENLSDENPKKDLGIFIKYPSLSDAKTLSDIEDRMGFDYQNDFEEKEMFLSELLNMPKNRLSTNYSLSLSIEECVHDMANYDGDLICPNYYNNVYYNPDEPPSITSREYKFSNKFTSRADNSNNETMWALRSMFWFHWHNWNANDIPNDDILLEKAQEALEEEAYFTLYNISQCLKTVLSQKNKYKAYIYAILATFRIQDLKQLSQVGVELIYKKFNDCLKLLNFYEPELFDFLPPKSDIEHAIELAPKSLKSELEKTADDFDNIINEASYKIVERCLSLSKPFYKTASKYILLCRPDYKDVCHLRALISTKQS